MQTAQLLPERSAFLAGARRQLLPGGLLALAITAVLEDFGDLEESSRRPTSRSSPTGASPPTRPRCARSPA